MDKCYCKLLLKTYWEHLRKIENKDSVRYLFKSYAKMAKCGFCLRKKVLGKKVA